MLELFKNVSVYAEAFLGTYQSSKMELFAKSVLAVILAKRSTLDVWQGSKYASVYLWLKGTAKRHLIKSR